MGPGFESLMVHHIFLSRGIAQLVEQRSPKPRAAGSNPSAPAIVERQVNDMNIRNREVENIYHSHCFVF